MHMEVLVVQREYVTLPSAGHVRGPAPVPTADMSAPGPVPGDSFGSGIVAPVHPSVSRNLFLAQTSVLARSLEACPPHRMEGSYTKMDRHNIH